METSRGGELRSPAKILAPKSKLTHGLGGEMGQPGGRSRVMVSSRTRPYGVGGGGGGPAPDPESGLSPPLARALLLHAPPSLPPPSGPSPLEPLFLEPRPPFMVCIGVILFGHQVTWPLLLITRPPTELADYHLLARVLLTEHLLCSGIMKPFYRGGN